MNLVHLVHGLARINTKAKKVHGLARINTKVIRENPCKLVDNGILFIMVRGENNAKY